MTVPVEERAASASFFEGFEPADMSDELIPSSFEAADEPDRSERAQALLRLARAL